MRKFYTFPNIFTQDNDKIMRISNENINLIKEKTLNRTNSAKIIKNCENTDIFNLEKFLKNISLQP